MAASAACSNPHVFAHTLRFSARGFLALTKNAWFLEAPLRYSQKNPDLNFLAGFFEAGFRPILWCLQPYASFTSTAATAFSNCLLATRQNVDFVPLAYLGVWRV